MQSVRSKTVGHCEDHSCARQYQCIVHVAGAIAETKKGRNRGADGSSLPDSNSRPPSAKIAKLQGTAMRTYEWPQLAPYAAWRIFKVLPPA